MKYEHKGIFHVSDPLFNRVYRGDQSNTARAIWMHKNL